MPQKLEKHSSDSVNNRYLSPFLIVSQCQALLIKQISEKNKSFRAACRGTLELRLDVVSETNIILNIEHWDTG